MIRAIKRLQPTIKTNVMNIVSGLIDLKCGARFWLFNIGRSHLGNGSRRHATIERKR